MKRLFQACLFSVLVGCTMSGALACTCVQSSLAERYRKAKAVSIGQAIDPSQAEPPLSVVQGQGQQTVAVIRSWKGTNRKYISINFMRLKHYGACPVLFYLEPGQQYLVFAYGKELEVRTQCSDTWVIPSNKEAANFEIMQDYLNKLSSRWFRFRAPLRLA